MLALSQTHGCVTGGDTVYIKGEWFDPFRDMLWEVNNHNDIYVYFGDQVAPISYLQDDMIEVIVPSRKQPGAVTVSITLNNVDFSASPTLTYEYCVMPRITEISPISGGTEGNTTVLVHGQNFEGSQMVL
ncbi:MAG: IPT/TIG domain-containing protein [Kangiellaceae bacterium]|jgi:hypothetical protein|nr:IPT/TIG domain-containing protein [Kangiellaceae bacterium]